MSRKKKRDDRSALLVGVSNPATVSPLVGLSEILTQARPLEILLTHVVPVASQISLTTGRSSPDVVRARDFLEDVLSQARAEGVTARALVEVARSVDEGLLAAAESQGAAMILVGYSGADTGPEADDRGEEKFDRAMHRVARKADADVVLAKFRKERMQRILVPLAAAAPLRLTGTLCRALAAADNTSLTYLHVAEPGGEEEARLALRDRLGGKGLLSLGPLVVVSSESPVDSIVAAAEDQDLVILGPSGRPRLLEAIISSSGRRIAESVDASVLVAWAGGDGEAEGR